MVNLEWACLLLLHCLVDFLNVWVCVADVGGDLIQYSLWVLGYKNDVGEWILNVLELFSDCLWLCGRILGKLTYLICNDTESFTCFSCMCGFDGGVHCKEVCLLCNGGNDLVCLAQWLWLNLYVLNHVVDFFLLCHTLYRFFLQCVEWSRQVLYRFVYAVDISHHFCNCTGCRCDAFCLLGNHLVKSIFHSRLVFRGRALGNQISAYRSRKANRFNYLQTAILGRLPALRHPRSFDSGESWSFTIPGYSSVIPGLTRDLLPAASCWHRLSK